MAFNAALSAHAGDVSEGDSGSSPPVLPSASKSAHLTGA